MCEEGEGFELSLEDASWSAIANCADARAIVNLPPRVRCVVLRYKPHRRVLLVPGRPPLVVKQFDHRGALDSVKNFWRGAPAVREWRALGEAERRGLTVPKALAVGARNQGSVSQGLLVTGFIDTALPLEDVLAGDRPLQNRWRIIRQMALAIRTMHDAGYFQRDLHLGNLLYRDQEPDCQLFLVDLQRIDVDPLRPTAKRWRDLAALHGGCPNASRSDRMRFLRVYLSGRPPLPRDERRLICRLDHMGLRHRFRLWRSRQKRCLADNREFLKFRRGPWKGFVRRDAWTGDLGDSLAEPGQLLRLAAVTKDSRTTTVGRVVLAGHTIFVKRYNYQGVSYACKNFFRGSRAKRVWCAGNGCFMRGVSVALPIAYVERRRFRVLRESYLITAAAEGETLSRMLSHERERFHPWRDFIRQLALYLRRMHERGVAHRDLKMDNIVVRREHGEYRFSIVDLDGLYLGSISWRRRVKNLVRLVRAIRDCGTMSRAGEGRLLKNYLGPRNAKRFRRIYRKMAMLPQPF